MANINGKVLNIQYEDAIAQNDGVIFTKVVLSEDDAIEKIDIMADESHLPQEIVDAALEILQERFHVDADPDVITVSQEELSREWQAYLSNNTTEVSRSYNDQHNGALFPRFQLLSVNTIVTGLEVEVRVKVSFQGKIHEGVARGPKVSSGKLFMVAAATMQAVSNCLNGKALLIAEEVIKMQMHQRDSILASVTMVTEQNEETFLGSVFVKEDENEAASKAALDAINRRIANMG